jgi:hypothetical protein
MENEIELNESNAEPLFNGQENQEVKQQDDEKEAKTRKLKVSGYYKQHIRASLLGGVGIVFGAVLILLLFLPILRNGLFGNTTIGNIFFGSVVESLEEIDIISLFKLDPLFLTPVYELYLFTAIFWGIEAVLILMIMIFSFLHLLPGHRDLSKINEILSWILLSLQVVLVLFYGRNSSALVGAIAITLIYLILLGWDRLMQEYHQFSLAQFIKKAVVVLLPALLIGFLTWGYVVIKGSETDLLILTKTTKEYLPFLFPIVESANASNFRDSSLGGLAVAGIVFGIITIISLIIYLVSLQKGKFQLSQVTGWIVFGASVALALMRILSLQEIRNSYYLTGTSDVVVELSPSVFVFIFLIGLSNVGFLILHQLEKRNHAGLTQN